ncbi:MAG: RnfABCDGE type electron transport complex subunit D [Treponema sp.]|nr:RnfABCDGE type electron transport complex subunit D [Treponema sp.]
MKNKYDAVSLRPFTHLSPSLHTKVYAILIVLVPQIVMLVMTNSWNSLLILLTAVLASVATVGINCLFSKPHVFDWGLAIVRGLLIGMLIPSTYPLVPVFFVVFVALLILKYFLGGFTNSWVNPVALILAVCWLLSAQLFPAFPFQLPDLQTKNTSLMLFQNGTIPVIPLDIKLTSFFNNTIFSVFGVSVPEGYISLFWDSHSLIPAFRFNLLTLVSSIFLFSFDIISALIPAVYLIVYGLLVHFLAPLFYGGTLGQGDMLLALLTSGTLYTALFLLQWYGTVPITTTGQVFYGLLAGITAFFVVGVGCSSVGSAFTILVMNVIVPFIHAAETASEKHYLNAMLLPRVQAFKDGQNA